MEENHCGQIARAAIATGLAGQKIVKYIILPLRRGSRIISIRLHMFQKMSASRDFAVVFNPIRRIRAADLTIGQKYPIRRLDRVDSKFGEAILASIMFEDEHCQIYLPQYFTRRYSDDQLYNMSCDLYDLIYEGPLGRSHKFQIRERNDKIRQVRPTDFTVGDSYPLIRVERITTMYGECLLAFIMHKKTVGKLYLPKYFTHQLNDEQLKDISTNEYVLVYQGPAGHIPYRVELRNQDLAS